uniref:uncharacterized protein LOC105349603 n=1 Tax=Fragaria vesca subsp. vesca TaxID=101020 RepID=UPI0005C82916|nr:PREDICTED: uncharacterized protein LOC105349603 [Fragaria vesca subsp. vesca]
MKSRIWSEEEEAARRCCRATAPLTPLSSSSSPSRTTCRSTTSSASASPASTMSPSSSSSGATHTIVQGVGFAAELHPCSLVEISGPEMIPPSDDAIMIRFMFYKETMHTFAETWTHGQVEEYLMIPESPTKAITVRPSEFYHQDAASIVKSPSGRMMIDFIDTHFPPEDKQVLVPKLVATIIDLVQVPIHQKARLLLMCDDATRFKLCIVLMVAKE